MKKSLVFILLSSILLASCDNTKPNTSTIETYEGVEATKNTFIISFQSDFPNREKFQELLKKKGAIRIVRMFDGTILTVNFPNSMSKNKFMKLKKELEKQEGVQAVEYNHIHKLID